MRIQASESLLLVVDLQSGLLPAIDGGEAVLSQATWLVDVARTIGIPMLVTEHCPQRIGLTDSALRARFLAECIVEKTHFSAVTEGALLKAAPAGRRQWVVAGTEAHVCVQQTVLDLLASGHSVFVVDEAVGSRRARDKELALGRMQQNGAEIVSREMVAFEWLESANNPAFRDVLRRFIR
ncbi:isochorismatase family protein [Dechloromonas sp. XY25]|uniref:Isochorismatase family protein n=1 Tax=Dechloromonas hankyongensis TaxID=2908002 RepID=A0ABS9K194_9RHOO|nr:isochorismatase family protein [Dechloromonas hankyongensis]MCG2576923.1 isochorismatase family protein [Dechloromonas hankyongensis]